MNRDRLIFILWLGSAIFCFWMGFYKPWEFWGVQRIPEIHEPRCRQAYERLFQKKIIDIRLVFGYKDARPARFVGDRYEKNALIEALMQPCTEERFDCGFKRSVNDAELFLKKIRGLDQKLHQVQLRLVQSSVGPDDDDNRRNPFQAWQSERAQSIFNEGLQQADIVFYNGHSRDGGGPDFSPPRIKSNRHVDYRWYATHRPGLVEMHRRLGSKASQSKLIGLYSCVSEKLRPRKGRSQRRLWLTNKKLIYYADALAEMRKALSDLIGHSCERLSRASR